MCDLKKALFITCPKLRLSGSALHSSLQFGGLMAWSFQLRSCMFGFHIATSILDVWSVVTCSFGYASTVGGDSRSSKINSVWQSSHLGAAPFCVVQDVLWGILYQNRRMDGRCSAILALPFFPSGWDARVQKSSVTNMKTRVHVLPC